MRKSSTRKEESLVEKLEKLMIKLVNTKINSHEIIKCHLNVSYWSLLKVYKTLDGFTVQKSQNFLRTDLIQKNRKSLNCSKDINILQICMLLVLLA